MDLNQLLHRYQLSMMSAKFAAGPEARKSHEGLAALYAQRIHDLRRQMGAGVSLI